MRMRIPSCLLVLTALAATGCYETKLRLADPARAAFLPGYCGEWQSAASSDGDGAEALFVARIDEGRYYAEYRDPPDEPLRMSAILVPVGGAVFAQVRILGDDDGFAGANLILRVDLDGDALVLRQLDEDFFSDVTTDRALRRRLARSVDDDAMYDADLVERFARQ